MRLTRVVPISFLILSLASCKSTEDNFLPADSRTIQHDIRCDNEDIDSFLTKMPVPISYYKEIVITAPDVVDDPCRTTWRQVNNYGKKCDVDSNGRWTFGHLMKRAAAERPINDFIRQWLESFRQKALSVNGFPVPPRPRIDRILDSQWARDEFPRDNAPLRLLAIVNRTDLAGKPGPYKEAPAGECRILFGITEPDGTPLEATVSFEYILPFTATRDAKYWANAFHELSSATLGGTDSDYNKKLQSILDEITAEYAIEGRPNHGSALLRVRTNELAFGDDGQWQMREYRYQTEAGVPCDSSSQKDCLLRVVELSQTPDKSLNGTSLLASWLLENQEAIANQTHEVPSLYMGQPFRGGTITVGNSVLTTAWAAQPATGALDPQIRHLFSFATCNGCHYTETGTTNFQVAPRHEGTSAELSPFLQLVNLTSPTAQRIRRVLPNESGYRYFNEPRRRACEIARIMTGSETPYGNLNQSIVQEQ